MSLNPNYKLLIRETLRNTPDEERKKRRRNPEAERTEKAFPDALPVKPESDSEDSDEFEDVDLSQSARETPDSPNLLNENESDNSDAFEDLEDVDLDAVFAEEQPKEGSETLTFTISSGKEDEKPASKRSKFVPISKEERLKRKFIHQLYLMAMISHGVVRNRWCNDYETLKILRKLVDPKIATLFAQEKSNVLDYVKSRRLVEGTRRLVQFYGEQFKSSFQGLVRKDWSNLLQKQEHTVKNVNLAKFRNLITSFRGSRDTGAQGFVALLRSLGVNARLVFSLQPPDYRSVVPAEEKRAEKETPKPKSEFDPVFIPAADAKAELLSGMRSHSSSASQKSKKNAYTFPVSPFPIFWVEVWNKYSRKWISVDPIVNKLVEVVPSRRKCKFDAPATERTHQTWYVLAFDRYGGVKDVTRRYSLYYNAKTVKKRIGFASEEDEHWYGRVLRAANSSFKKCTQTDILESKEFHDRDVSEGVPNNVADFKNHPVYALESQLRQDEVVFPNDLTSKCGTFRSVNKNIIMPIVKRSHVFRLRTAKAWHMRGRILKVGAQPLKTKEKNVSLMDEDDDDDGKVRLYAEFQTLMYLPPPIVDGKIVKNAFGNVEIFTRSMIPENGFLVELTESLTMKLVEKAARDVLRIDYARAIVKFDFGSGSKRKRGAATAKEGGILIDAQYKEAMLLVLEGLQGEEEENRRRKVELNALLAWRLFLSKLRIKDRLDKQHGKIKEEAEELGEEEDGYFSVASDDADSDEAEKYYPRETTRRRARNCDEEEYFEEGGFMPGLLDDGVDVVTSNSKHESSHSDEGGFLQSEVPEMQSPQDVALSSDEGGFLLDEPPQPQTQEVVEDYGDFCGSDSVLQISEGGFPSDLFAGEKSDCDIAHVPNEEHSNKKIGQPIEVISQDECETIASDNSIENLEEKTTYLPQRKEIRNSDLVESYALDVPDKSTELRLGDLIYEQSPSVRQSRDEMENTEFLDDLERQRIEQEEEELGFVYSD